MQPQIVLDMRCLQDLDHFERGIQAHARCIIGAARNFNPGATLIGLTDPALPALPASAAAWVDAIRPNAYLPELGDGAVFLNPAPLMAPGLFAARLLLNPGIVKVAIVYDFIPLDQRAAYLADQTERLDYFADLAWLRRYDLFIAISGATEARLRALWPLPAAATAVSGVALPDWVTAGPPAAPAHILVVGGDDQRKNPELAIRAHACAPGLQARRIPLVIAGNHPAALRDALRALPAQYGGDPDLLIVPGRLDGAKLMDLYRRAYCVVTPSRAEGFSLPVIEAMAAGVPAIATDIPAHAELITDSAWRFSLDDDAKLAGLMERLVTDSGIRAGLIEAQAAVWPRFTREKVAERVWGAVAAARPAAPRAPAVTGRKPRIAMLTPLPPARSGIADYSASLAHHFGDAADLCLFAGGEIADARPVSCLPMVAQTFDRVVCVMGNSGYHNAINDLLMRYGAACICHDSRLLGFTAARFGLPAAAAIASREVGRVVTAAEIKAWGQDEERREASFLGGIAGAARPLIFHSHASVDEVGRRFGTRAAFLPFAVPPPWPDQMISPAIRAAARERLGIGPAERVIVSLGFIVANKGIEPALRALALLAARGLACRLVWVGQAHQDLAPFAALAAALGISPLVTFTDRFVGMAEYRDWLAAADCGLQLRQSGRGNLSAALGDCIAAGLPSLASADLAENLDAPEFIRRVADPLVPAAIADGLAACLAEDGPRAVRAAARFAHGARYSMANYAKNLCDILGL